MAFDIIKEAGYNPDEASIRQGLKNVSKTTGLAGRWQVVDHDPLTVCDNAHNADGIREVIQQINNTAFRNLHIIMGVVKEKKLDDILKLLPSEATYYFTKPSVPRALDENILQEKANDFNLQGKTFITVEEAYKTARQNAHHQDFIFIGGSTFVVADFLQYKKD